MDGQNSQSSPIPDPLRSVKIQQIIEYLKQFGSNMLQQIKTWQEQRKQAQYAKLQTELNTPHWGETELANKTKGLATNIKPKTPEPQKAQKK